MTDVYVTPITDENREDLTKLAIAMAGTHRWNCMVCGKEFLQADSKYWKVHNECIEEFKANKERYQEK